MHKTSASQVNVSQQAAAVRSISQRNICHLLGWDHIDPVDWQGVERFYTIRYGNHSISRVQR